MDEKVNVVIAVESELDEVMGNFCRAYDDYHCSPTRVEAQEESVNYFTEQVKKYVMQCNAMQCNAMHCNVM